VAVEVMYHVGSKNERPGKTGFAHLFEHLMFKGSANVADGEHFRLLQEVGASVNGSTTQDRTNYYETIPPSALELALFLEADRMGSFLPTLTSEKLDNQREVVKNERRQNYENQPYGLTQETLFRLLFTDGHPYSWPVIGFMPDLDAASLEDARAFFTSMYIPANAVLVVAGTFVPDRVREWIEKYFGGIASGLPPAPVQLPPSSPRVPERAVLEDRVLLPRLVMAWHGPSFNTRESALLDVFTDVLSAGKNSRLYRRLVFDLQIAQSVLAYHYELESAGVTIISVTAKPGRTLADMERAARAELDRLLSGGLTGRELERSINGKKADFVEGITTMHARTTGLATFATFTGDPRGFVNYLQRYEGISCNDVSAAGEQFLGPPPTLLRIIPRGQQELLGDSGGTSS
jgi:zinc protease